MPSSPFTAGEVAEARLIFELVMAIDSDDDSDDDSVVDALTLTAVEPLQRKILQDVGPEKLSLARLQREAIAQGRNLDDLSITDYITFGFRLEWLPAVIAALDVPDEINLDGDHVCIATAAFATPPPSPPPFPPPPSPPPPSPPPPSPPPPSPPPPSPPPPSQRSAVASAITTALATGLALVCTGEEAVPPAPKHGSVARQRFEIFKNKLNTLILTRLVATGKGIPQP
jgi:hypothetical protein